MLGFLLLLGSVPRSISHRGSHALHVENFFTHTFSSGLQSLTRYSGFQWYRMPGPGQDESIVNRCWFAYKQRQQMTVSIVLPNNHEWDTNKAFIAVEVATDDEFNNIIASNRPDVTGSPYKKTININLTKHNSYFYTGIFYVLVRLVKGTFAQYYLRIQIPETTSIHQNSRSFPQFLRPPLPKLPSDGWKYFDHRIVQQTPFNIYFDEGAKARFGFCVGNETLGFDDTENWGLNFIVFSPNMLSNYAGLGIRLCEDYDNCEGTEIKIHNMSEPLFSFQIYSSYKKNGRKVLNLQDFTIQMFNVGPEEPATARVNVRLIKPGQ